VDIFRLEPMAFDLCDAVLIAGTDGVISAGYTLTSAGSDFTAANTLVQAGDVLEITFSTGPVLVRVDAIPSATTLTIARLGCIGSNGAAFLSENTLPFTLKTMDSYIKDQQFNIGVNKLRLDDPNIPLTSNETGDDYTNLYRPESVKLALAHFVLASFFESNNMGGDGTFTDKREYHNERGDVFLRGARILLSSDGSDTATDEISPGAITMKRT
jgi:hypothetical protein